MVSYFYIYFKISSVSQSKATKLKLSILLGHFDCRYIGYPQISYHVCWHK